MGNLSKIVLDDETLEVEDTKARTDIGDVSTLQTTTKENLVEAVNECFQSASDGKALIASAITGMGVNTNSDATYAVMAGNIAAIETGVDTSDATATAEQILSGATAYNSSGKITGNMPNIGSGERLISTLNDSTKGLEPAIVSITDLMPGGDNAIRITFIPHKGYYDGINSKMALRLWGMNPASIAAGTTIGCVENPPLVGTYTADANATAAQILYGRTAYVNGNKVTGTMNNVAGQYASPVSAQMNANLDIVPAEGYYNGVNAYLALTPPYLAGLLGITADKILTGNTICGVTGIASSVYSATVTTTENSSNTYIMVDYNGTTNQAKNSIASFTTTRSSYEQIVCTYVTNSSMSTGSFGGMYVDAKAFVVPNVGVCLYLYPSGSYYYSMHTYGSVSPYYWVTDNGNGTYTHNIALALLASGSTATIKAY